MKKHAVFFLLICISVLGLQAQPAIQPEGKVVYDLRLSGKGVDPMAAMMMAGSTLEMSFKGDMTRAVMKMTIMKTTAIIDTKTQEGVMLMDMMGKKMAMEMKPEDVAQNKVGSSEMKVEKATETKKIAGHLCNLAYVVDDSTGEKFEVWYCPYLKVGQSAAMAGFNFEGIDGLPMEMDFSQNGTRMRMVAKSVTIGRQDEALFKMEIPEGYKLTTQEELQGMMR